MDLPENGEYLVMQRVLGRDGKRQPDQDAAWVCV